jgi:cyclophilin family peptidyl-prolyl cis-trans isomerase
VRTYAAIAADTLRDIATLTRLSRDEHPNVRTAAIDGLRRLAGHAADTVYIAQLSQNDSQLLQSAAMALDSSTHPGAVPALLSALDRITTFKRETSRDARKELLARIGQLGNVSQADRLRPYLRDFDPQIAQQAAAILQNWTGTSVEPAPVTLPAPPLPTFAELESLSRARVVLQMLNSAFDIEIELMPFDAPTNVARFVRLIRANYFNNLTFHRIAPNFVVQGGSPNANEYTGDGPFSRDELGQENNRGTIGLSTRGRDTGDAQIYFNLIDNTRLDHDYTVFARVVSGMDVVDRMLEGAVIRRIQVR